VCVWALLWVNITPLNYHGRGSFFVFAGLTVDLNHPLAGESIIFEVTLVSIDGKDDPVPPVIE